jgi:hypothetical protein
VFEIIRLGGVRAVKDCRDFPNRGGFLEFGGATGSPVILQRPRGLEPVITGNLE